MLGLMEKAGWLNQLAGAGNSLEYVPLELGGPFDQHQLVSLMALGKCISKINGIFGFQKCLMTFRYCTCDFVIRFIFSCFRTT